MIETNRVGSLRLWTDLHGRPILHPQVKSHICVPVFGTVPDDSTWKQVKLETDGVLRNLPNHYPVIEDEAGDRVQIPICDERFPWAFCSHVRTLTAPERQQVIMQVGVTRSVGCYNPEPMPLSLGLRTYFATHNSAAQIRYAGKVVVHSHTDSLVERHIDLGVGSYEVETVHGRIAVHPVTGFDRVHVESSNPGEYLSVSPSFGKRVPAALDPGDTVSCVCMLTFHPHP